MKRGWAGLLALALVTGCGPEAPRQVVLTRIEAAHSSAPEPPTFVARTDCTPMGRYVGPAVGSRYIYRGLDGARSSREILGVSRGVVEFRYRDLGRDLEPLPPRQTVAGMLVLYPPQGQSRTLHYETDPVAALEGLAPGATIEAPTLETSRVNNRDGRLLFPTTIHYRSCGVLQVGAETRPVRVYEVGTARRVKDGDAGERVRQGFVTYYLDEQSGFPLAYRDSGMISVVQILAPANSPPPR